MNNFSYFNFIPYPYCNREYAVRMSKDIFINETCFDYENEYKGGCWELIWNADLFIRSSSRSFEMNGINKRLAALFHGRDFFDISDMFPNSKIVYIKGDCDRLGNNLSSHEYIRFEGRVFPNYYMQESGGTFGMDIVRKINNKNTFLIQFRLPIFDQLISHREKWNDVVFDDTFIKDDRLYLDELNYYFKARNDYMYDHNIIPKIRSLKDTRKHKGITFLEQDDTDYFLKKNICNERLNDEEIKEDIFIDSHYQINEELHEEKKSIDSSHWYSYTEFLENGMPAIESLYYYQKIYHSRKKNDDLFLDILSGKAFGESFNWDSLNRICIAPLDIQINWSRLFFDNVIIEGLLACVIPMQKKKNSMNLVENGIFEATHAIRIGSQISWDINRHYKFVGYGSWQYHFPSRQSVSPIFDGVNAYGLLPLFIPAKVSWAEWYLAGHLVIKYNDYIGVDLGYQYINKSGDNVVPECQNTCLIDGNMYELNYQKWKEFSKSIANLITFNLYYYYKMMQFDLGVRGVINGMNTAQIFEYSFRIGIDY